MKKMAEKKLPIDINVSDDVEKTIEAKKMDIIKTLLTQPNQGDPISEVVRLSMMERLMRDLDTKTDFDEKILSKALTYSLIQQALNSNRQQQQDLTPLLLFAISQRGGSEEFAKLMQAYLQQSMQNAQAQQQFQQQLFNMLFSKQHEEMKEEVKKEISKQNEVIDRMMNLFNAVIAQSQNVKEPKLKEYVRELIETKQALEQLKDHLGLGEKETPVVDEKGKVQAGKLIERGLKLAEKIIEKMPAQAPQPKPVQQIPIPQPPQITQPQPEVKQPEQPEQPEVLEEEKLQEIEQKVEDLEKKAEVTFNIPEQTAPPQEINIAESQTNIAEQQNVEYGGAGGNETEETPSEGAGEQELNAEVVEAGVEESEESGHSEGNKEQ